MNYRQKQNAHKKQSIQLHIIDQQESATTDPHTGNTLSNLKELLDTLCKVTGLDACIYPPPRQNSTSTIHEMPLGYLRHRSPFCLAAKKTRDAQGCRRHDSFFTNARAANIGRPFVQTCHRGVAEVIIPIYSAGEHLGTVFLGQVITPEIEARGFEAIWESAKSQVTNRQKLQQGFEKLPRMTEEDLLCIGKLAHSALQGLADQLSTDAFATQVKLQSSPVIRRAVDILYQEHCWDITAKEMSQRIHIMLCAFQSSVSPCHGPHFFTIP
jgi:ligand-binding sensor protein